MGFTGELVTDLTKPDGTPRKTMDVTKLFSMGWKPNNTFEEGLKKTWNWYLENKEKFESKKKSA